MAAPRNDNVKEKILDAATGLLDTQTFADISLAEIAAAAGVSKGTLYYYYKNKTDILFDLTNRYLDRQWNEQALALPPGHNKNITCSMRCQPVTR